MELTAPLPSNRSFGRVFVVFFLVLAALGWWHGWRAFPWLLGAAGLMATLTLFLPDLLAPFNRAWMKFAEILNRIVSPLVMGVIFFGLFTPTALFMRLIGRDTMNRKFDPQVNSYWTPRDPPGPDPLGLPNQF